MPLSTDEVRSYKPRQKAQSSIAQPRHGKEYNPGTANPKQLQFFQSKTMFTAYGGAKGGG